MMRKDFLEQCALCPRRCSANRNYGQKGFCGETKDLRLASAGLHFGEEPPVTGLGGSGTLFFTGCTLRCAFCQNYQISQGGMGREISSKEFTELCLALQEKGAHNINLVTGSHFIPQIAEYLAEAKKAGLTIPAAWNSSAYENVEALELLRPVVDIWLPDLKTLIPMMSESLFGAANYPQTAKKAIRWMVQNYPLKWKSEIRNGKKTRVLQSGVIIRHLFMPGRMDDTKLVLDWLKQNADKKALISLMSQYTPVPFEESEEKLARRKEALSSFQNRLVSEEEDSQLKALIDAYDFDYLFYQDLSDDTSWLPDFTKNQPFSNKLAKTIWCWQSGLLN